MNIRGTSPLECVEGFGLMNVFLGVFLEFFLWLTDYTGGNPSREHKNKCICASSKFCDLSVFSFIQGAAVMVWIYSN